MSELRIPLVGEVIADRYLLRAVLGQGGMGVVFAARDERLGRPVAIKVLAPEVLRNPDAAERFLNEARAVTKIASDRVVQVLDVGELEGRLPFMVMERLEGKDLAQLLEARGPLPVSEAVDLVCEALEGVAHAHLEGIVHRDLKPSNLFLALRPDGTEAVKVLDFGISKVLLGEVRGNLTQTSAVLGSPLYMSPEQLRSSKHIDARTDLWSLGVIVYELLTQTMPYEGDNMVDIFAAIQEDTIRPLHVLRADVPAALDAVVGRCLARSSKDRYADVFALGRALAPFGSARARRSLDRMEEDAARRGYDASPESSTQRRPPVSGLAQESESSASHARVVVPAASATGSSGASSSLGLRATLPSEAPLALRDEPLRSSPAGSTTPAPTSPGRPRLRSRPWVAILPVLACSLLGAAALSSRRSGQSATASASPEPSSAPTSTSQALAPSAAAPAPAAAASSVILDAATAPAPAASSPATPVASAARPTPRPAVRTRDPAASKPAPSFNPLTSLKPL